MPPIHKLMHHSVATFLVIWMILVWYGEVGLYGKRVWVRKEDEERVDCSNTYGKVSWTWREGERDSLPPGVMFAGFRLFVVVRRSADCLKDIHSLRHLLFTPSNNQLQ